MSKAFTLDDLFTGISAIVEGVIECSADKIETIDTDKLSKDIQSFGKQVCTDQNLHLLARIIVLH